ncbi:inorganic diphosphatase [Hyphomonas pacifica]|uniref:inorganic diphosphatase n=1 Tax=Hyphomonas pacifica TaxID=1280941 RepID=UPI000DBF946B|nr:inorganic diphosphatase [Hyphomonas pacifica]RAN36915.1 hypothetical protein HY11_10890 [Hyphomonas pacifica]
MSKLMSLLMGAVSLTAMEAIAEPVHPFAIPQPVEIDSFYAIIEIPAGSFTKYEIDEETGYVRVDRFLSAPVGYPANYGSIPSSLAGDGDPLDALVLTRQPVIPGAYLEVRAIGVLRMTDAGHPDDKIISVPSDEVDPFYKEVRDLSDLPEAQRDQIEAFFLTYKQVPAGGNQVVLSGYGDAAEAQVMVEAAFEAYGARLAD